MGSNNGIFEDFIGTLLLIFTIILYVPILTLIFLRRKTQPIRHRSPYLMMISLVCSFVMAISLSMILFLDTRHNNTHTFTCGFYIFNVNILHFTLIIPYILRAFRLLNVFNIKYYNNNLQKYKLKEAYYVKLIIIISAFLVAFYILNVSADFTYSVFPIELEICQGTPKIEEFFKYIWIFIHFFECCLIILFVWKLKNIRDEFKISNELLTVGCFWLVFEIFFLMNGTLFNIVDQKAIILLDIWRNFMTVIVSGLIPVIRSFKSLNLPICTTKECAANFNLLLFTEKTYDAFFNYLKAYMPEGAKFLSFHTELNVFKHTQNHKEINILSTDIYEKYLNENSDLYIDFPSHLIENLHKSYQNSSKSAYSSVFDSLGEFVYNTLKEYYYPNFKMSNEYRQLESELERDEAIYSRLVASSMIQSADIEL